MHRLDDEPVMVRTTSRPIVALPYNFEIRGIVMMVLQHHASEVLYRRARKAVLCKNGVVAWDGAHVLDWYLSQRPVSGTR